VSANSRINEYSENKAIYIYIFKKFTSSTHRIINIHIYLYYMHIKDYPTHSEEFRLKEISDERLEKLVEDR